MTSWWAARAWVGDELRRGVVLRAADGVLVEVAEVATAPGDAEVLSGVVLPGAVNAHSHAFHRALRGRTHRGRDSFWSWREQMYRVADRLNPETYRGLARGVFAEMLEAGYTSVGEFHYLHHGPGGARYVDPNEMSLALVAAATDVGIRMTLLDTLYLEAGPNRPPEPTQLRFSDGDVEQWAERTALLRDSGLIRHGLAVHSVRAVPPDAITVAADVAAQRAAPLHAHVSEQPRENAECVAAYGQTPVRVLASAGALTRAFTAVHATHLTDDDVRALGGCGVCVCPTTERDLADGIGPMPALRAVGSDLSLGSDSHAVIDALEEARAIEMDERLGSLRRGTFTAPDLWTMASAGGARALGWPSGGLAVGQPADFVEVGAGSVRLAGADLDAGIDAVVHAATAADVQTVVVGGAVRVRDGRHIAVDSVAELDRSIRDLLDSAT